ncbi:hypothetical protein CJJ07_001571 [Candidozyma auris]|nr:hypothetical protein CJJ07_001571 [[Candida] auris]QEL60187.1 hypothetical protein CJJ09_002284 [[Candida] auris]
MEDFHVPVHYYLVLAAALLVAWHIRNKAGKTGKAGAPVAKSSKIKSASKSFSVSSVHSDFDWRNEVPLKSYPYKDKEYRMTMGISKLDIKEWLLIDNTYLDDLEEKRKILHNCNPKYPKEKDLRSSTLFESPEADLAIREFYDTVLKYMCSKFPMYFKKDEKNILNTITGERLPLSGRANHSRTELLEALTRTIQEDFIILLKDPSRKDEKYGDEYFFKGGVFAFAAGFDPINKFDKPLTSIHAPIPGYEEKLKKSMNRYFDRLAPCEIVLRSNFSIQTHEKFYVDDDNKGYHKDYLQPEKEFNFDAANQIHYRSERQTLTKLPESGAIVFTIRTYLHPFSRFAEKYPEDGKRLAGAIRGLPRDLANYKGAEKWGVAALSYLDQL